MHDFRQFFPVQVSLFKQIIRFYRPKYGPKKVNEF